jgi:hypothetical protein
MSPHRVAGTATAVVVAGAVIAGLWLVGSPDQERLRRLDARRVDDLQGLVRAVDLYYRNNDSLPGELETLVDGRTLSRLPLDPVTEAPYEYRQISADEYELCADFSLRSQEAVAGDFWFHDAGRRCYSLDATGMPRAFMR